MMPQLIRHTARTLYANTAADLCKATPVRWCPALYATPEPVLTGDFERRTPPHRSLAILLLDRGCTYLHTASPRSYMHQRLLRRFDGIAKTTGGHSAFLRAMCRLITLFPPFSTRSICLAAFCDDLHGYVNSYFGFHLTLSCATSSLRFPFAWYVLQRGMVHVLDDLYYLIVHITCLFIALSYCTRIEYLC